MKTLIVFLFIVCGIATGQAQKVTQLKETKVEFAPYTIIPTSDLDTYEVVIKENYIGQFSSNALKFVKENFDVNELIQAINETGYDSYLISFKSSKGFLDATYSKDGEMVHSNQMFKDIVLPLEIRREVYINYKDWTMAKNKYVASGNGDKLNKEIYRINLKKDNKRQNIKIIPSRIGSDRVVSN
ncbi:MAG: hypothetical protein JJE07_01830 [Flavobacteriaceae bacterium]|nr:hypothetical protein [Flavobacteriaceae bacterium]